MKKAVIITLVFLFLGVLILTLVLDTEKIIKNNPESLSVSNNPLQKNPETKNDPIDKTSSDTSSSKDTEYSSSIQDSTSSSSGAGDSSGTGTITEDSSENIEDDKDFDSDFQDPVISCTTQISYAVGVINEQKTLQGINCSLNVRNLEYETSGIFIINLILLDENSNKLETIELSKTIHQRQEEEFFYFFEGASPSNKCRYETVSIPKKEVC